MAPAADLEAIHDATSTFPTVTDGEDYQLCLYDGGMSFCGRKATVFDIEFLCDHHWLFCSECGRGLFKGIGWVGCPSCHAEQFHKEYAR